MSCRTFSAPCARVAAKHGVSMANVATRWVLDQPAVAAVIVGARLGEREHRADNLRLFSFALDDDRPRDDRRGARGDQPDPRRLRQRVSPAAFPHRVGRSQPSPAELARRLSRRADAGPSDPAAHRHRQRLGADLRLQPGRQGRRPHPGQRHHRDPWRRASRLPRRSRTARRSTSSTRSRRASRRSAARSKTSSARASIVRDQRQWEPVARVHGRYLGHVRPANTLVEVRTWSVTTRSRSRPRRWWRGDNGGESRSASEQHTATNSCALSSKTPNPCQNSPPPHGEVLAAHNACGETSSE